MKKCAEKWERHGRLSTVDGQKVKQKSRAAANTPRRSHIVGCVPTSPNYKVDKRDPPAMVQNKSNRNDTMERITFNFVIGERG